MANRRGRGRLSKINMLPPEADETVRWAALELREETRTQIDIGKEFNEKLAMLGLDPISPSSFNRHSIRLADMVRRSNQTREIAAVLTDKMEPGQSDDVTIMLADMIKSLIAELLDKGGEAGFNPKAAKDMADALRSLGAAEKMSNALHTQLDTKIETAVDVTIEKVTKTAGLSTEQVAQIRRDVLGVR